MAGSPSTIKVAVTQAEPEWLDLEKAVKKTCALIEEAASNGAKIVTFPECWITGYPAWIWSRPVDFVLANTYIKNGLQIPSPELDSIRAMAKANAIGVVLGFSENHQNSLYIAQAIIGPDGALLTHRRKIKPTHMERTIFGDAAGGPDTLENCVPMTLSSSSDSSSSSSATPVKVSALACWEHAQPLLKYHTALARPTFHAAAWPPVYAHGGAYVDPTLWSMSREGCRNLSQTFAVESQAFVLHSTAVLTAKGIDRMGTAGTPIMGRPGGGSSAVYGPDGRKLTEDLPEDQEGILYAECDVDEILKAKGFIDLGGHYSRPDILWLGVDAKAKKHSVAKEKGQEEA
ncbi:Nitrilase cyanide hydratase conserved site [Lasiodiplodia theobromae]|uniref:Nitrilase cyanide hydratase conserved site n=1 Tax=Lasiodiplodia theobromae TaxID=45133 RepID=UPI0015C3CE95|nr:Nitrilase cyanide hydratase conserved site [Lasiodiplodia theobromae]KAF4534023.1 Nitrilase cyanide hydratase conserved site [Lasiodiplodia theobromae]